MDSATPKQRILLIEDNLQQALLIKNWLEMEGGYEVVHAEDGPSSAQFAQYGEWDLVVSDIELPGIQGVDLVHLFKAHHPWTPVLLITAHERMDYAIQALRNRADDILIKPLEARTFLDKVAALIEASLQSRKQQQAVVLAIGAHPDDVEIGCGGALFRHQAQGDKVAILTLSGGEQGGVTSQRMRESEQAADMLGASLQMAALKDTAIGEGLETISEIEKAIRVFEPTVIYTHTPNDGHQDHRNVHKATMVAARSVPSIYCYQAPSTTVEFRPNLFIDVTPYLQQKLELIGAYKSQVLVRAYLEDDLIRATARYWGRFAGYSLVEPMEVMRQSG